MKFTLKNGGILMHQIRLIHFQKTIIAAICILAVCAAMMCAMVVPKNKEDITEPLGEVIPSAHPIPTQTTLSSAPVAVTLSPIESSATKTDSASSAPAAEIPSSTSSPALSVMQDEIDAENLSSAAETCNPYANLTVTNSEKRLLARMAYSEAGNQSLEGQVAVIQVALNRCMHPAFPGNISDVLFAPHQFIVGHHYEDEQMEAVEAALAGEPVLDLNTDVVFFSTGSLRYGSYYKTIGDHVFRTYS